MQTAYFPFQAQGRALAPAQIHAQAEPPGPPELLELVDFKWLMVGEGHRVDLDRLQREPAYARGCLAVAAGSTSSTLRRAAEQLGRALERGERWRA